MKIAIAELAGVDPRHEIERARRAGMSTSHTAVTEADGGPVRGRRRHGTAAVAPGWESAARDCPFRVELAWVALAV
ncbi:hypothetical protein GCM10023094_03720 [Rhodococcus olei]|uniref:Uncharacterized protein n=1 Tax=Rhodococcus olei TaxID=2161675 RepID=A0ABP8NW12_9NOCA